MGSGDTVASAVLWDIDGTLLSAKGSGARCFRDALTEVAGHPWPAGPHDFGGRTDVDIGSMILLAAAPDGPVDPEVLTRLLTTVERMYETREAEFAGTTVALPGVHDAVDALDAAGVLQTVVTGNMASIARRKLRAVGLDERLRLDLGAYGDDHADRAALMAAAVERLGRSRRRRRHRSSAPGSSATRPATSPPPAPSAPAARSSPPGRSRSTSWPSSTPTSSCPTSRPPTSCSR